MGSGGPVCWKHAASIAAQAAVSFPLLRAIGGVSQLYCCESQLVSNATKEKNVTALQAHTPEFFYGEKKPIKKHHIKEFGGRDAPEASQGQTRDVPGHLGHLDLIYV